MFFYNEFIKWSELTEKIIIDLNISIKNIKRLISFNSEYDQAILRHGFFAHHFHQLRFIIVIQLCKLLSDRPNEKISFVKLCNKIKNEKLDSVFIEQFHINANNNILYTINSRKELKERADKIKDQIESHQEIIRKIVDLRNWAYAHVEPKAEIITITIDDLESLVSLASNIHNDIFKVMGSGDIGFERVSGWEVDAVINQIAHGRKLFDEKYDITK